MPRRSVTLLAALVAAAALTPLGPLATTPAQALGDDVDPLEISISSMSPAVLPQSGPVRISGTVTNRDTIAWTTINLYSFVSSTPMTTAEELTVAAELPPESTVGERIADPASSATVEELAPGDTLPFSFSVPRARIPVSEPGVYWFGVQALGQGPEGRDLVADGRSRTFVSALGQRAEPVPSALVLPLRRALVFEDDGSVADLDGWARDLAPGGRLRSVVDFGASAGSRALTWLVDPALVDAARRLAAGNPARSLAPTVTPEGPDGPGGPGPDDGTDSSPGDASGSPSSPASGAAAGESETAAPDPPPDPLTLEVQALATDWLARLGTALPGHQVLALPYGDLDVAGAADHRPRTYASARARTGSTLAPYDVPLDPAVSSPGGYLDADAIALTDAGDTVLLTDLMFTGQPERSASPADSGTDPQLDPATDPATDPDETDGTDTSHAGVAGVAGVATADPFVPFDPAAVPTVATDGVRTLVVTSSAAATGVGPGDARSPLSLRQQLLAQAAVRSLSPDPQPLAVMLPSDWNPTTSSGFFSGLDVSWLDLRSVDELDDTGQPATPVAVEDLDYPRFQERLQIGPTGFQAAEELARAGDQLQSLLLVNDQVGRTVRDQALTSVSYSARSRPLVSRLSATGATRWVEDRLAAVRVQAPVAFTMTGTSGRFSTTVVNDLDQPVTVGLRARADSRITVEEAVEVEVPARGEARVLLNAIAPEGGVHTVQIGLVDAEGTPLGTGDELTVRALAVSNVIWLFLGAAGALLLGAIVFRLVKRVRAARRTARAVGTRPGPALS